MLKRHLAIPLLLLHLFLLQVIGAQTVAGQSCPSLSIDQNYRLSCQQRGGFLLSVKDSAGCQVFLPCLVNRTGLGGNQSAAGIQKANASEYTIRLQRFSSNQDPILGNVDLRGSGEFLSTSVLAAISCSGPSPCECELLGPDPVQKSVYPLQCLFHKPVNGAYDLFAYDEYGRNNSASGHSISLIPGSSAKVVIEQEPVSPVLVAAAAVIAIAVIAFGAFRLFDWMFADYRKLKSARKRKEELEKDFKMLKYRFMKREIDEPTFKKFWAEKEKEYTEIKRTVSDLEKLETGKQA